MHSFVIFLLHVPGIGAYIIKPLILSALMFGGSIYYRIFARIVSNTDKKYCNKNSKAIAYLMVGNKCG